MTAVELARGQNAPLASTRLTATVELPAAADLSALLLTADAKVRGDSDIVFYNQPEGPGVRCVPPSAGQPWQLHLDLAAVPAEIAKVRVVTSLDEAGRTFGSLPTAPVARVSSADGTPVAQATLDGLTTEAIVVAVEFYRRDTAWKIRAVGQGYGGGLADLLRDHGVDVADEPAPAAPTPTAAAPTAPAHQPTPPAHQAAPQTAQAAPSPQPAPVPPSAPTAPAGMSPAPVQSGLSGRPRTTPPELHRPQTPPPPAPAQPHDPYAPGPAAPPPADNSSLTRGRPVNLSKGQSVNLRKDDGSSLSLVRMGLGWDPVQRGGLLSRRTAEIDLDASAILLAGNDIVDLVFYNRLMSADGSVRHAGDNRTGAGDGDDEVIMIDLPRVPVHVTSVVLVVTSYEGHTFQMVQNAFCRLIDEAGRAGELVRYQLSGGDATTGMVMAALRRTDAGWRMEAIGEAAQARVPQELFPMMNRFAR